MLPGSGSHWQTRKDNFLRGLFSISTLTSLSQLNICHWSCQQMYLTHYGFVVPRPIELSPSWNLLLAFDQWTWALFLAALAAVTMVEVAFFALTVVTGSSNGSHWVIFIWSSLFKRPGKLLFFPLVLTLIGQCFKCLAGALWHGLSGVPI